MGVLNEEVRNVVLAGGGIILPYLLRSIGEFVLNSLIYYNCCQWICGMTSSEFGEVLTVGTGDIDVNEASNVRDSSWDKARKRLKINKYAAIFIGIIKLMCWHWWQPIFYILVLYYYWDSIDKGQQILGIIVGCREGIYFLLTIIGLFVRPVYLLVDSKAIPNDGALSFIGVYVFAPEKYILICFPFQENKRGHIFAISLLLLMLLDISGIVAVFWALAVKKVFVPLVIAYALIFIGDMFMSRYAAQVLCEECLRYYCTCCNAD